MDSLFDPYAPVPPLPPAGSGSGGGRGAGSTDDGPLTASLRNLSLGDNGNTNNRSSAYGSVPTVAAIPAPFRPHAPPGGIGSVGAHRVPIPAPYRRPGPTDGGGPSSPSPSSTPDLRSHPAAYRAASEAAEERAASMAASRLRDGLCPTCGTRLYKLKRRTTRMGLKKVPPKSDGSEYRRVPLTIEGEVMRGQCLRCPGAGSVAVVRGVADADGVDGAGGDGAGTPASVYVASGSGGGLGPPQLRPIDPLAPVPPPPPVGSNVPSTATPYDPDVADGVAVVDAVAIPYDSAAIDPTSLSAIGASSAIPDLTSATQVAATYRGEYNEHGQRHGRGELLWENGDRYEGQFWNGMRDGEGTLHFADGTEYVGTWRLNKMDGEGTRRYANGNVYTGEYRRGRRSGQGRCYFANGDLYVGAWKEDAMEGYGRYHYNSGNAFEGNFRNGRREGRGKYQHDGQVDVYRYVNDRPAGEGVRWSRDRKKTWRLLDGKKKEKVSVEVARAIAERCGRVVDNS